MPHPRNLNFTGREPLLDELHRRLSSGEPAALVQAIHGLGGIGKTMLAAEYAYRHRDDYAIVWWLRAEDSPTFAADYAALGVRLGIVDAEQRDLPEAREAVRAWLAGNGGWLLVFDNAESPDHLRPYLPPPGRGALVVTSRVSAWGGLARSLRVEVMTPAEAVAFLLRQDASGDEAAARALADEVGHLPLALEHARAFVEETGTTLAAYLKLFQKRRWDLLTRHPESTDYRLAVGATWEPSFEAARRQEPAAADLLTLCAFMAPDAIPLDLPAAGAPQLPEPLRAALADDLRREDLIGALRRYSLVERQDDGLTFHRLVQAVARDRLSEAERQSWAGVAANTVWAAVPADVHDVRQWAAFQRLLPHVIAAAGHAEHLDGDRPTAAKLLGTLGIHLWARADLPAARAALERALRLKEAAYGPDHPEVARGVEGLGIVLRDLGELPAAGAALERALRIEETVLGPEHPAVAITLANLGAVLHDLGDLPAARAAQERAHKIFVASLGDEHPHTQTARRHWRACRRFGHGCSAGRGTARHRSRTFLIFAPVIPFPRDRFASGADAPSARA